MKRFLSLILSLAMFLSLCIAAQAEAPEVSLPFVQEGEDVTLEAFIQMSERTDDYENNKFTKWLQDQTGINLKFITAPANNSDAKTKLNLLLNSNDYPDIIWYQLSNSEMSMYGMQGIFIRLNELIDQNAVYLPTVFEEYPNALSICSDIDGNIYGLPYINDAYHMRYTYSRCWFYNPWLEKLGGKLPETTDELYDFLMKIKTEDPNGNGEQDEIPLMFSSDVYSQSQFEGYFFNAFLPYPSTRMWLDEDKNIQLCYTQEEYREALRYIHKLYEDGLIMKESFTITAEEARAIAEDPTAVTVGVSPAHGPEMFTVKAGESGRFYEYLCMPPVEGPNGVRYASYNGPDPGVPKGFITNACENPVAAIKLMDYLYDLEVTVSEYIGLRGENWDWVDDPNSIAVNGQPAVFRLNYYYGTQPMNDTWMAYTNMLLDDQFNICQEAEDLDIVMQYLTTRDPALAQDVHVNVYNEAMKYYESKNNYDPYIYDPDILVPVLKYDEIDSTTLADLTTVIDTYRAESMVRFITGDLNIDTDWDKYLNELQAMGIDQMREIMQNAYDRLYK